MFNAFSPGMLRRAVVVILVLVLLFSLALTFVGMPLKMSMIISRPIRYNVSSTYPAAGAHAVPGSAELFDFKAVYSARWVATWTLLTSLNDSVLGVNTTLLSEDTLTLHLYPTPGTPVALASATRPRTVIVMADDRKLPEAMVGDSFQFDVSAVNHENRYYVYAFLMNFLYTMRHGYDLYLFHLPGQAGLDKRFSAWAKILAVMSVVDRYDFVLWIDSDSYFRRQFLTIEELGGRFGLRPGKILAPTGIISENAPPLALDVGGNHFLVSRDLPGAPHDFNTGIFLLWVNDAESKSIARAFLAAIWTRMLRRPLQDETVRHSLVSWAWEQSAMHAVWKEYEKTLGIAISPMRYMTSPEGENLRHFWSAASVQERTKRLQDASIVVLVDLVTSVLKTVSP